ncbi:ABC transporter ATP-binding protein [Amycolatopsis nigrescens]|uniref:ABC transporter ATP-binding protein n=1 Tax=Amycolatopsis nigrescens TaxID=381445 RepID=UPI0003613067|nr:ABC transporter ATP-binding protein [Amycolatopsis nigrescens]
MIRQIHRLYPHPGLLVRMGLFQAVLAVLQGLLLGLLVPVLRALLRPEPDFAAATPWLITGAIGFGLYLVLSVITTPVGFAASSELTAQLRHRLMGHLTTLPLGWFSADRKAQFVRTVTGVTAAIARICVVVGGPVINCVLVPATVVVVTFTVDWRLASLLLVAMPIAVLVLRASRRITVDVVRDMEVAANEVTGRAIEFGQAQSVLRAAGQAGTGTVLMRDALAEHRRRYRRGLNRLLVPSLSYTGVVMAGFVVVLVFGARFLLDGSLPVADAVALLVLAVRFLEPIGALADFVPGLGAAHYCVERVEEVLETPSLRVSADPVRRLEHTGIEFSDVTFSYGGPPVLTDVSFHCRPGTTTALVGPSGSGKTTVTRLIARFFDIDSDVDTASGSGSVRVGGVDVRELDHATLLNEIAIVFQDVYLFDTTIEDNLRLARPDATRAELVEAARAARLDEVIARLPEGWHTRVGEAGAQLSGGERQRVSIARAFLKQAPIVLIDEAGSALDPENERAISHAIADLAKEPGRTVIVIAHRPATLATADHVVALDAGRVTETGTPAELHRAGGTFARLYNQYEHARSWHISTAR